MNYEEATEHSFKVPWKTVECRQTEGCWCKGVWPVDPIEFSWDHVDGEHFEEFNIVDFAVLPAEYAEYFVKLHNEKIKENKNELEPPSN